MWDRQYLTKKKRKKNTNSLFIPLVPGLPCAQSGQSIFPGLHSSRRRRMSLPYQRPRESLAALPITHENKRLQERKKHTPKVRNCARMVCMRNVNANSNSTEQGVLPQSHTPPRE